MGHDLIVTAFGFLLMLCVYGLGMKRERARQPAPPKAPNLFCGCGDELSMHDGLGACQEKRTELTGGTQGNRKYQLVQCSCQQYTGDLPADWYVRNGMPS